MFKDKLKTINIITALLFAIAILLVVTGFFVQSKNVQVLKDDDKTKKQLVTANEQYEKKNKQVHQDTLNLGKNSDKKQVKYIYSYDNLLKNSSDIVNKFFSVFHTWDDLQTYQSRPSKLQNIASKELLDNKEIFDSGLDSTGGDMITALDLKTEFKTAKITVVNTDENAKLLVTTDIKVSEGRGTTNKVLAYELTYNQTNKQITSLKKLTALQK